MFVLDLVFLINSLTSGKKTPYDLVYKFIELYVNLNHKIQ